MTDDRTELSFSPAIELLALHESFFSPLKRKIELQ